ncbi:MAG: hypothetical protein R3C11_00995 [Planctomycetaceae bacterium]
MRSILPQWTTDKKIPLWRNLTVAYCFLGALTMIWLPRQVAGDILSRMTFGAVVGGATLCGFWCFAMLWVDRTRLPAPLRMSRILWVITFLAGVGMSILGVQTMIVYFQ